MNEQSNNGCQINFDFSRPRITEKPVSMHDLSYGNISCASIPVIVTKLTRRGSGLDASSPIRIVTQVYDTFGNFIADYDPTDVHVEQYNALHTESQKSINTLEGMWKVASQDRDNYKAELDNLREEFTHLSEKNKMLEQAHELVAKKSVGVHVGHCAVSRYNFIVLNAGNKYVGVERMFGVELIYADCVEQYMLEKTVYDQPSGKYSTIENIKGLKLVLELISNVSTVGDSESILDHKINQGHIEAKVVRDTPKFFGYLQRHFYAKDELEKVVIMGSVCAELATLMVASNHENSGAGYYNLNSGEMYHDKCVWGSIANKMPEEDKSFYGELTVRDVPEQGE